MKILHISNYFYPHIGGIEQTAKDIIDSIGGAAEQKLICFNHEKSDVTEKTDNVEITRAKCFAKVASQSLSFSFGKRLKKIMRDFAPDIVVFHYPNPFEAHYLLKALKKSACRLIIWWHLDITKQKLLGKLFSGQSKRLLERADRIVATSPNYIAGSKFLSEFADKVTVIPSCIDETRLVYGESETERAERIKSEHADKILCFAFGRHIPYKGYDKLIRAAELCDENIDFCIGGSGPLTETLVKQAEGNVRVTFTGRLEESELKAYLLACDIFCFPSVTKNEAFGLALAEAMYFGKPAVTFTIDGSGVNYVSIDGETGTEVPNSDVAKYAEAINELARNADLRAEYGKNAKARVTENFLKKTFAEKIKALIADVCGEKNENGD